MGCSFPAGSWVRAGRAQARSERSASVPRIMARWESTVRAGDSLADGARADGRGDARAKPASFSSFSGRDPACTENGDRLPVHSPSREAVIMSSFLLVLASVLGLAAPQSQEDETDAHGFDKVRIEQEDKLLVPKGRVEEVWEYLRQRLCEDKAFLASLDPGFTSKWDEELFHDTYFDTPSMQLYAMKSGVRHRKRENLTNPDDAKSGRELMPIKVNAISDNDLERAEIKFDIDRMPRRDSPESRHPMLGRVKKEHREPFKERLVALGLDPMSMRPILTVVDRRRRVYVLKDDKAFMSVSFDQATSDLWWGHAEFCEIEPELNEIGFTEANAEKRAYMETVLQRVVQDIHAKFPDVQRDLTPKYNKAFDRLEEDLPFLRSMVSIGLQDDGELLVVFGGVVLIAGCVVVPSLLRGRRRRKRSAGRVDELQQGATAG